MSNYYGYDPNHLKKDSRLWFVIIIGLILCFFWFRSYISESAENYDKLKATYLGEEEWQYYDIAPSSQNLLWLDAGNYIKRNREYTKSENDVRKEANKNEIIAKAKKYDIEDFVGHIVDIDSDEIEIWANNLQFYIKFSNPDDVWDLKRDDLVKFSMTLKNYQPVKTADLGWSGDSRLQFFGKLRSVRKIGEHRKIDATTNYK